MDAQSCSRLCAKLSLDLEGEEATFVPLEEHGPLDPPDIDAVKKEPYRLPASFVWADLNLVHRCRGRG